MEDAIKSLPYFKQSDNYITSMEKLSGGQQNINFKVTNTKGQKYVCRIPGVDAFEHGQIHENVYKNWQNIRYLINKEFKNEKKKKKLSNI